MRSWYLGCSSDQVGQRAILVGDRSRVIRAAEHLTEVAWLNEDRGLTTVTGRYDGTSITVAGFGMGAPSAAVVLHELAQLGVHTVLRLGTMMSLSPVTMGELILASAAVRREAVSATYLPLDVPAVPDPHLQQQVRETAAGGGPRLHLGLVATYDGFYTQMVALEPERRGVVDREHDELRALGVIGIDMETSAILVIGQALGVRAASLCAATVEASTQKRLPSGQREELEDALVRIGIDAVARA